MTFFSHGCTTCTFHLGAGQGSSERFPTEIKDFQTKLDNKRPLQVFNFN